VSSLEVTEACLERIDQCAPLNAFRAVLADEARAHARLADRRRADGSPLGPLHGVPLGVKDNIDVAGVVTTAGVGALRDNVAARNATVVERLHQAGAILTGKTHLSEWAIGATTHNRHFGPARNPWDPDRSAGGSSGGSAAAVAAGALPAALGTDTSGSLRVPAALTGLTTLRPTTGLVSCWGVVPVSWTLDTVGPLARSAADVALVLAAIAGYDDRDPAARLPPPDADPRWPAGGLDGLRVGCLGGEFRDAIDPAVAAAVDVAARELARLGADVSPARLSGLREAAGDAATILLSDAAALHEERVTEAPEELGDDVLARLRRGMATTGREYARAREAGRLWRRRIERALTSYDVLLAPACPTTAPLLAGDPLALTAELTRLAGGLSLAGVPVVVAPCGFEAGLPIGMQLIGPAWSDAALLGVVAAYQRATNWHERRPGETWMTSAHERQEHR
jgi:aspartyl-tRNA(Asn)/glutamyl-tRNA(Gln) amidotransferase subunit A